MIRSPKPAPRRPSALMLGGWLLSLASGAVATSLLRVPVGISGIGSATLTAHVWAGAIVGLLVLWFVVRGENRSRMWPAAAVGATLALGWLGSRSFAPPTVAAHAALAAISSLAIALMLVASGHPAAARRKRSWKAALADAGLMLLSIQVVLGALLRHHLVSVFWHLLVAGLAALAVLVPAVTVAQDSRSLPIERRASRWAVNSIVAQSGLGVAVLILMMTGSPNPRVWVFATVTHVVLGSVTLVAAGSLSRVLRPPISVDSRPVDDGGS